ncbi:ArsR family transcriptional regulator [Kineococcus sp. LSe6-4]|uniref:ArsR family transcriptional regulator n=1 Tax=Kineococcus halophytocola TaxID=3234027 RepID=A0ABV4H2P8_9ACTN
MKVSAPALLPILRSDAVGEILARLYLMPEHRWTLNALAEQAGVSLPTLTREADRMVAAGLVLEERVGRTRQLRCNRAARTFEPLHRLMSLTYGPVPVLESELSGLAGVARAYVYGSWAARHQGVEGPEPADIDVLVVGDPDQDEVFDAGERARVRLLREVNVRTVTTQSWERARPRAGTTPGARVDQAGAGPDDGDPFLRHVLANPLVPLDLDAPTTHHAVASPHGAGQEE